MRLRGASLTAVALALAVGGCGAGAEVGEGASVTVYVSAPLRGMDAALGRAVCSGSKQALERSDGRAGTVRVRLICLDDTNGRRWTLADVSANARRASEDSTTVGYIGETDPAAARFSETILEEASIAQLPHMSGAAAMHKLLKAIVEADTSSGSLREAVRDELQR